MTSNELMTAQKIAQIAYLAYRESVVIAHDHTECKPPEWENLPVHIKSGWVTATNVIATIAFAHAKTLYGDSKAVI